MKALDKAERFMKEWARAIRRANVAAGKFKDWASRPRKAKKER